MGAVGKTLEVAGQFASTAGNAYKTVTDGVSSFISNMGKGMVNNVSKALGGDAVMAGPETISEGFSAWMEGVSEDISGITSPFSEASKMTTEEVTTNYLESMEEPIEKIVEGPQAPGVRPSDTAAPSPGDPIKRVDVDKLSKSSQANVPDASAPQAPDFSVNNKPYQFKQEDLKFHDMDSQTVSALEAQENKGLMDYAKKFVGDTVDKTMTAASEMPGRAIDTAGQQAASSLTQRGMQEAGLGPEQEVTYQQVSNYVPSFDFTPIDLSYQQAGLSYGGLPSNRLEYYAFNNQPQGDFGGSSFRTFSQFRPQ